MDLQVNEVNQDAVRELFNSIPGVSGVEIERPYVVIIRVDERNEEQRKAVYAMETRIMDLYPAALFDFHVWAGKK